MKGRNDIFEQFMSGNIYWYVVYPLSIQGFILQTVNTYFERRNKLSVFPMGMSQYFTLLTVANYSEQLCLTDKRGFYLTVFKSYEPIMHYDCWNLHNPDSWQSLSSWPGDSTSIKWYI